MSTRKRHVVAKPLLITATLALLPLLACSSSSDTNPSGAADASTTPSSDIGSCSYVSPFTRDAECREFTGSDWSKGSALAECETLAGEFNDGRACETTYRLGTCSIPSDSGLDYVVSSYGDAENCELQKTGCEVFGGGSWVSEGLCGGGAVGNVFIQPTLECRDPIAGEAAGLSEDGQVCTWQAISGCTEEGRRYSDYASCDVIRTQRPYYPAPPAATAGREDSRLENPSYVAELDWVKSQVAASACVCCHSTEDAPEGTSNWFLESPGNWIDSLGDSGLAFGANVTPSIALGAYPPEDNNGFARDSTGFPSTDPERMLAFFRAELVHRGLNDSDFDGATPFGGPIYDQLFYEPEVCDQGEGVASDGSVVWTGGGARYVYILANATESPTVPPNLDRPASTLWRIDVGATEVPVESGDVRYGILPSGTTQSIPASGTPTALVNGQQYYLYVSKDVGLPITRCLFTY